MNLDRKIHPLSRLTYRDQINLYRREMGFEALLRQSVEAHHSGYEVYRSRQSGVRLPLFVLQDDQSR